MTENSQKNKSSLTLAIISISSALISVLAGVLGNYTFSAVTENIQWLKEIHWVLWIYFTLGIYTIISLILESISSKSSIFKVIFRLPTWSDLRSFTEQPAAKSSYWALIIIPLVAYLSNLNLEWFDIPLLPMPLNMKLAYFASWFIALSLIVYAISSPKELKEFNPLDKVKTVNLVLNNNTETNVMVKTKNDPISDELDHSFLLLRSLCFYFYIIGVISAVIILFRGALVVINA